jgi:hypothetical protein
MRSRRLKSGLVVSKVPEVFRRVLVKDMVPKGATRWLRIARQRPEVV